MDKSQIFNHKLYEEHKKAGKLNLIEPEYPDRRSMSYERYIKWCNEHTPRYEYFQEWQQRMCKG